MSSLEQPIKTAFTSVMYLGTDLAHNEPWEVMMSVLVHAPIIVLPGDIRQTFDRGPTKTVLVFIFVIFPLHPVL